MSLPFIIIWIALLLILARFTWVCAVMTYLSFGFAGWRAVGLYRGIVLTLISGAALIALLYHPRWVPMAFNHIPLPPSPLDALKKGKP